MVDVLPPVGAYPKWEVNGSATEGYITISVMQSGNIFVKQEMKSGAKTLLKTLQAINNAVTIKEEPMDEDDPDTADHSSAKSSTATTASGITSPSHNSRRGRSMKGKGNNNRTSTKTFGNPKKVPVTDNVNTGQSEMICHIKIELKKLGGMSKVKDAETQKALQGNQGNQLPLDGSRECSAAQEKIVGPSSGANKLKRKLPNDSNSSTPKLKQLRPIEDFDASASLTNMEVKVEKVGTVENSDDGLSNIFDKVVNTLTSEVKNPTISFLNAVTSGVGVGVTTEVSKATATENSLAGMTDLKTEISITNSATDNCAGLRSEDYETSKADGRFAVDSLKVENNPGTMTPIKPVNLVKVIRFPGENDDGISTISLPSEDKDVSRDVAIKKTDRVKTGKRAIRSAASQVRKMERAIDHDTTIGLPLTGETFCPICCREFESYELLKTHVLESGHYERNWMCKLCLKRFITRNSLKEHIKLVHAMQTRNHFRCKMKFDPNVDNTVNLRETEWPLLEQLMPCELCDKMVKGKCMEFHLKCAHSVNGRCRISVCYQCGLNFPRINNLLKHNREVHGRYFDCDICGEKFNTKAALKMHKIRVHGEDSELKCEICGMKFARPDQVRNHMVTHSDARPEKCTLCDMAFKNRTVLCQHVNLYHGISLRDMPEAGTVSNEQRRDFDKYLCSKCGQTFKGVSSLRLHYETSHPDDILDDTCISAMKITSAKWVKYPGEHLCTQCGKVFKSKSSYNTHVKYQHITDDIAKPYECEVCGKTFKSKSFLDLHSEWHLMKSNPDAHKEKARYRCPICDRGFKYKQFLDIHKSTHKEFKVQKPEFSAQCPICGATLKSKVSFKDHMDNHEGLMKFQCKKCDKVFPSRGRLYNHRSTHNDVSYQCETCGSSFKQKSYLKRHVAQKHEKDVGTTVLND